MENSMVVPQKATMRVTKGPAIPLQVIYQMNSKQGHKEIFVYPCP